MDGRTLLFFQGHEAALPLYCHLTDTLTQRLPDQRIDVKKTQISFFTGSMWGCVSFLPVVKDYPPDALTLTLSLPAAIHSPRVQGCTQPYPGRYTHHVLLRCHGDVDEALLTWIDAAADFARSKRRHC